MLEITVTASFKQRVPETEPHSEFQNELSFLASVIF